VNLLQEFKNDIEGLKLLNDWLGSGGDTVSQIHAEHRAITCTMGANGDPCPLNKEPGWWDRVKSSIANTIKMQLEMKQHLKLHVSSEEGLAMCAKCGCALPLKVWVPIEHIKAHTDPEKFKDAPPFCWLRQELSEKVEA
jgi:hypothetical protein